MSSRRRSFSREFKMQVLEEADSGVPVAEVCRRYELGKNTIDKWREQLRRSPENPFPGKGSLNTERAKIQAMERIIGRQAVEIDFLKNALERLKGKGREPTR